MLKKYQVGELLNNEWAVVIIRFNQVIVADVEHGRFNTASEAQELADELNMEHEDANSSQE